MQKPEPQTEPAQYSIDLNADDTSNQMLAQKSKKAHRAQKLKAAKKKKVSRKKKTKKALRSHKKEKSKVKQQDSHDLQGELSKSMMDEPLDLLDKVEMKRKRKEKHAEPARKQAKAKETTVQSLTQSVTQQSAEQAEKALAASTAELQEFVEKLDTAIMEH